MLDLGRTFLQGVERRPQHLALVDGELRLTYAQWHARIRSVCGALMALGLRRGDHLVVVNRVLPSGTTGFLTQWREIQERYMPVVQESFAPVPLKTAPLFEREVVGLDMLYRLGAAQLPGLSRLRSICAQRHHHAALEGRRVVSALRALPIGLGILLLP